MEKNIKEYYIKLLATNLEKSENNNFLTKLNYQRWSEKLQWSIITEEIVKRLKIYH